MIGFAFQTVGRFEVDILHFVFVASSIEVRGLNLKFVALSVEEL